MNTREYLIILNNEPEPNRDLSYYDDMIHDLYSVHAQYYENRQESGAEVADYQGAIDHIVGTAELSSNITAAEIFGWRAYLKENGII